MAAGASKASVARELKVSRMTVYRALDTHSLEDRTAGKAAHRHDRPASDYRELQQAWSWQKTRSRTDRG
ncbi:helix-turn-helix domain-containing protein [Sinorhizobium meliloti]|uniref:helix-turn-helix domain-containing protein n=1 Tax=Rhizobium meliloti TaxID=382 RepID=UPI001F474142